MKKLKNPFLEKEGYKCFGCAPSNKQGLQMEFWEDGDYIISKWQPKDYLQGYGNVLHGGIQTTVLDEISSWVVYVKAQTGGVTANLEMKFRKTAYVHKGPLTARAKMTDTDKRFAYIFAELLDQEGNVCSEGHFRYYIFPQDVARDKFYYPGHDAFYGE